MTSKKTCVICERPLPPKKGQAPRSTCSKSCGVTLGHRSRAKATKKPCSLCGEPVPRPAQIFCSRACRSRARQKTCRVDECGRPSESRGLGMCRTHARRHMAGIALTGIRIAMAEGERRTYGKGYVYVKVNGVRVSEHRWVMEQMIGRPLRTFETPHHRNGIKNDNTPSNLELWTKPQPAGQRPEDIADWMSEYYPEVQRASLAKRDARVVL